MGAKIVDKSELISQTKNAFDFIQKLYFEVSYLIKEVEGLLSEEDEEFVFGQNNGYAVTARSSNGLYPNLVNLWMYKKLAVCYIPKAKTRLVKGQTITHFEDNPKIFYMRIILDDKDIPEPSIYFGVLRDFKRKKTSPDKIEPLMTTIEYCENKVFSDYNNIEYDDQYVSFRGKLARVNLFDLKTSEDIAHKLIAPGLIIFRE
jgi:hypothetical protein